MIHQQLDYCQDTFLLLPFWLAVFVSVGWCEGFLEGFSCGFGLVIPLLYQQKVRSNR